MSSMLPFVTAFLFISMPNKRKMFHHNDHMLKMQIILNVLK